MKQIHIDRRKFLLGSGVCLVTIGQPQLSYAGRLKDAVINFVDCLLYTSPSPRDLSTSRMPSSA